MLLKTDRGPKRWDVFGDHCIRPNSRVIADDDVTQNLCTRADIDMTADYGKPVA